MSIFGFHVGPGGNPTGIGDYVKQLDAAGIPAFIMSADVTGGISDALTLINAGSAVKHRLIFRVVKDGKETYAVPDYSLSPYAAAVKYWNLILPLIPPEISAAKAHVWIQLTNEIDKNRADWLGNFGVEAAKLANAAAYKVSLFGWSSGEPEPSHWRTPGMLNYLRYCATHHEQAAVSVHEYSYDVTNIKNQYPYLIGRVGDMFRACDENGIIHPQTFITEWGWELNNVPDVNTSLTDITWANGVYKAYPAVRGIALWYLGGGFGDIANKVQPLIAPLANWNIANNSPEEPPTLPKIVIVKKPQKSQMTETENAAANGYAWTNYGRTTTHSVDDMIRMLSGGNADSYAVLAYPERASQIEAKAALVAGGYRWVEWPETIPPSTPQIAVTPISQRDPRWANVDMGGDGKTIGSWGCLLVTYNMFANYLELTNEYPPAHMTRMKNAGAMSGPYLLPGAMKTTFPNDITYLGYEGQGDSLNARIKASIDRGYPVPARVDFNPATGQTEQHWVLITGYTATDFWCADPWHGDIVLLSTRYNITGNDVLEGIFYERKAAATGLDMAKYFLPASGNYGQLFMLKNNWGAGDERCQLQADGTSVSYVTKNQQYEKRTIDSSFISLKLDTSPGNGEYYTVTGNWLPRRMSPGQVFTRTETITFRYKANCQPVPTKPTYTSTTNITLDKHHTTWTCPESNITIQDVVELSWFSGGRVDERYWFAAGLGLVRWEKYTGHKSWIHELIPVGSQGNNVKETGCFS
jgi:hypothetical protein